MAKILVAEDDAMLSSLLIHRLESEGFEAVPAYNGDEVLQKIPTERPDIILLDIMMPGKSGFDVLEAIQKDHSLQVPHVVVLSNLSSQEDIERAQQFGVTEFMVKARTTPAEVAAKLKAMAPAA